MYASAFHHCFYITTICIFYKSNAKFWKKDGVTAVKMFVDIFPVMTALSSVAIAWLKRPLNDSVYHYRQRTQEKLEEKVSVLKKDLVNVRESLSQTVLERDVLQGEKDAVSGALSKVRTGIEKEQVRLTHRTSVSDNSV